MVAGRYSVAFVLLTCCLGSAHAGIAYRITDLGSLGGSACAEAISDSGAIVGWSTVPGSGYRHAVSFQGGILDLGTLGSNSALAEAVNDSGVFVGCSVAANGTAQAFWYDGSMHLLGTLGGNSVQAHGINAQGTIVGHSDTSTAPNAPYPHAFLFDGTMHDLGTFVGGTSSWGTDINNVGQIVGYGSTADLGLRAFLYDGTMHDLGTLGGQVTLATAINESGQVVGSSRIDAGYHGHAFLYDGTIHDLGTLGGDSSEAADINDAGLIVGNSSTADTTHAFLYDGHSMLDLNDLVINGAEWELVAAYGINNHGQIVGTAIHRVDGLNLGRAFLLTPEVTSVPEPATLEMLLLSGCFALGLGWKRKRSLEAPHTPSSSQ